MEDSDSDSVSDSDTEGYQRGSIRGGQDGRWTPLIKTLVSLCGTVTNIILLKSKSTSTSTPDASTKSFAHASFQCSNKLADKCLYLSQLLLKNVDLLQRSQRSALKKSRFQKNIFKKIATKYCRVVKWGSPKHLTICGLS